MPKYIVASPCKIDGEIEKSGVVELTAKEAGPLLASGSLVPAGKGAASTEPDAGADTDGGSDE